MVSLSQGHLPQKSTTHSKMEKKQNTASHAGPELERGAHEDVGNRVDFEDPHDTYNPKNWTFAKKTLNTLLYGLTTLGSTWASAAYSPANEIVVHDYEVSSEVAVLGTSVLLLG